MQTIVVQNWLYNQLLLVYLEGCTFSTLELALAAIAARASEILTGLPAAPGPGETNMVGALLRSAIGNNLATYLTHRIWQPFGMESDADWMLEQEGGVEWGGCCIMATLRDYGRIGLFAMNDGVLPDGTRVLPEGWIDQSTTPSRGFPGYGYLWWLGESESTRPSESSAR